MFNDQCHLTERYSLNMPAYDLDTEARQISAKLAAPDTLLVACLCAAWCDTCNAYRKAFDALTDLYPQMCFVWIDVETYEGQLEALEIDNFPTLLIEDVHCTRFLGAVPPKKRILKRLLDYFMVGRKEEKNARPSLLRPILAQNEIARIS